MTENVTLLIEPSSNIDDRKRDILTVVKEKMVKAEDATSFEDALRYFLSDFPEMCEVIMVRVTETVISLVVRISLAAAAFAQKLEQTINIRFHQLISVSVAD